jgi:transposase
MEQYLRIVGTHGLPEEDRPKRCPKGCPCERIPHRHSHYERMVITLSHREKICIFRFRCPDCGYVHSVIPAFLEPYQQIALDLQEDLVDAVQQGYTIEAVAEASESLPGGGFDERTIVSLVRVWNERLNQLESGL